MNKMTDDKKKEFNETLDKFLEHIEVVDSHFYQKNSMVLTLPLLINAGAVITMASFFTSKSPPNQIIIYATLAFLAGAVFGLLTIVYELFVSYARWISPRKLELKKETGTDWNKINEGLKRYLAPSWQNKYYHTMMFRAANGALSIILCLIGIFFTASFILNSYYPTTFLALLVILYCSGSFLWLRKKLNS